MDQQYITAGYITLPLSSKDLAKFGAELEVVGDDPEGQALALSSMIKYASTMLGVFRIMTISVGPQRYPWQAGGVLHLDHH